MLFLIKRLLFQHGNVKGAGERCSCTDRQTRSQAVNQTPGSGSRLGPALLQSLVQGRAFGPSCICCWSRCCAEAAAADCGHFPLEKSCGAPGSSSAGMQLRMHGPSIPSPPCPGRSSPGRGARADLRRRIPEGPGELSFGCFPAGEAELGPAGAFRGAAGGTASCTGGCCTAAPVSPTSGTSSPAPQASPA